MRYAVSEDKRIPISLFPKGCNVWFKYSYRYCFLFVLFFIAASTIANSEPVMPDQSAYRLRFYHTHTGERLDIVYRQGNNYDQNSLARINQYLRDYRTGEIREYDPHVLDLLHDLLVAVGHPNAEINVICGYRTPHTNEYLRTHGHGVAKHSLHMQAMAIDIRMPGVPTSELRDAALALQRGGVGYYSASDFVHVDVGRVRRW